MVAVECALTGEERVAVVPQIAAVDGETADHDAASPRSAGAAENAEDTVAVTTVAANGIRLISRVELTPGRYQLRLGIRDSNSGGLGTVTFDLEVPDFAAEGTTISGMAITSSDADQTPTATTDEELARALPGPVTTSRVFSSSATLALFVEIYDTQPTPTHRVDITTTLSAPDGVVEFRTTEDRSTEELGGARGGFGHRALIPLGDLAPGTYVLRTEARSRLSSETAAVREVRIRIE